MQSLLTKSPPISLTLLLLLSTCGALPPPDAADDEAAVRESVERAVAAFNTSDVGALVDLHTGDAVVLKPGKPPEIGKQVMRASLENVFSTFKVKESRMIEELEIVGDWAFTWGYYSVTLTPADGSPPIDEEGKYIDVLRRQPHGSWLFARTMWNVTTPD
jgi:uncharacterized protein (TIGR02246 family)